MSYSLNPLKGLYRGTISGSIIGLINGDTRSVDNGSYNFPHHHLLQAIISDTKGPFRVQV